MKAFLTAADVSKRYQIGRDAAYAIIKSVKEFCGGGALPKGKILPAEIEAWELSRGGKNEKEVG